MGVLDEKLNEVFLQALQSNHSLDEDVAVAYGLSVEAAREAIEEAAKEYEESFPEDVNVERAIAEILLMIKPDATVRDFILLKAFLIDAVGSVGCRTGGVLEPTPDQPVVVLHIARSDGSTAKLAIQASMADLLEMAESFGMLARMYKTLSQLPPEGALTTLGEALGDGDELPGSDEVLSQLMNGAEEDEGDGKGYIGQDD